MHNNNNNIIIIKYIWANNALGTFTEPLYIKPCRNWIKYTRFYFAAFLLHPRRYLIIIIIIIKYPVSQQGPSVPLRSFLYNKPCRS